MLVNIEGEEEDYISGGCRETPQGGRHDLGCSVTAGPAAATIEHPHREGRLEYKYPAGKRSEEDAYS